MTVKNVAAICGIVVLSFAVFSDASGQEIDRGTINTDAIDKVKPTLKIPDNGAKNQTPTDSSSSVIELKNGSLVPARRLDGSDVTRTGGGAVIYGRGVYVTAKGHVHSNGKTVRKLAPGERLSVSDLEGWSRKSPALPTPQEEDESSPSQEGDSNNPGSTSDYLNLPSTVSREPNIPDLSDDPVEPGTIPVGREGKPEFIRAGTIYKCPDRIQVNARILPDTPDSNNRSQDVSIWTLNGDGALPISASELDVSSGGDVFFPICYYGGSPEKRSTMFTIIEVDRDAYKFCLKETRYPRQKHSYFCSPDEDWLHKFGNASLHNQEFNLDNHGTRTDIEYRTQANGQAMLRKAGELQGGLAILPSGDGRRGSCVAALDDAVLAIPQSELNPGVVVCYRTGLARVGYLTVIGHLPGKLDSIAFSYRTFAKFD